MTSTAIKQEPVKIIEEEKDRLLAFYLDQIKTYEKRFGTLENTAHVSSSDPLMKAIRKRGRYEKLNMFAGEWLVGE